VDREQTRLHTFTPSLPATHWPSGQSELEAHSAPTDAGSTQVAMLQIRPEPHWSLPEQSTMIDIDCSAQFQ
jgi:hypothetical protein